MIKALLVFGVILPMLSIQLDAQDVKRNKVHEIKIRSAMWGSAYNSRDSSTFFSLFDSLAVVTTAGGRWVGAEECKRLCRKLYKIRPDITWTNSYDKIEVNEQWHVAYETGDWVEAWTQPGDTTGKSVIKGKYWIMWKFKSDNWYIISGIFTPLSCTGSYCEKK